MTYNFDTYINRYNTDSLKFDTKSRYGQPEDVLPMWVADMDYPVLPKVTEAIHNRAEHPAYGYTYAGEDYYNSVMAWMHNRHSYVTDKDWYVITPSVVFALAVAVRAYTKPGDGVMINTPVYPQFFNIIVNNDRKIVKSPLILRREKEDYYEMDYAQLEEEIVKSKIKLYILCSPHNPVGRVWTKEELLTLGDILKRHNVLLVSDEIHMDFVYSGYQHHVFAGINKEFEDFTITCTSPSKTFNLAGLKIANIIIANKELRRQFVAEIVKTGYTEPNIFGMVSCQAAYRFGAEYVDQMMQYLEDNVKFVREYIGTHLPKVKLSHIEGTYLMWLDFLDYGLSQKEINKKLMYEAKLWLNAGDRFGEEGNGFQRINIAVPRSVLKQGFVQLTRAFS